LTSSSARTSTVDDAGARFNSPSACSRQPAECVHPDGQLIAAGIVSDADAVANDNVAVSGIQCSTTSSASLVTDQDIEATRCYKVASEVAKCRIVATEGILKSLRPNSRTVNSDDVGEECLLSQSYVLVPRRVCV
jgi:hypothetical protein